MPAMPAGKHGRYPDFPETRHESSDGHRFIMIRTVDSEPAMNRSGSSGTVQQGCAFRAFTCAPSLIWLVIPLPAGEGTPQTTSLRARLKPALHPSTVLRDKAEHSKPIARSVVQRFSP